MLVKTKTKSFTLVRIGEDSNRLSLIIEKGKFTTDEIVSVFRDNTETEKMVVYQSGRDSDYVGFTDFLYAEAQENGEETDLVMLGMGRPDLTTSRLKAALLHLSIATDNAEIAEDIEV